MLPSAGLNVTFLNLGASLDGLPGGRHRLVTGRTPARAAPRLTVDFVVSARRRALVVAVLLVAATACGADRASGPPAGVGPIGPPGAHLAGTPLDPARSGSPGTASWAPWPSALHDARHTGASTADGPTTDMVRWHRRLEGAVTPGPVVGADGTVYAASNGGVLHALDPATGADRWTYDSRHSGGGDLSTSPLVLLGGTVLWGTAGRDLVALSPAGAVLWTQRLPGTPTSPASADGRRVYVGDMGGGVTALDVGAGGSHRVVWTLDVGSTSYGSVVTDGSGRLYTTADSALVAVDDRGGSGAVAWRADPGDDITEVSAGLAPDGTALLGTNGAKEWAYHRDGTPRWSAPRVITYSSPSVTADGLAYVADHSGRVRVLDVGNGTEVAGYQIDPPQQIWSSVAVDRGHRLYFGTQDGHLHGVDPAGAVLFDVALGAPIDSYPALTGDGAVVIGARNGELVAVG